MSAEQVQAALMRLVRYPSLHRGAAMDAFVAGFDLDAREEWQVRALASSTYVAKFGRAERRVRFEKSVLGPLPATSRVLSEAIAERIFAERFEPAHPALGVADVTDAFVAWLVDALPAMRAEPAIEAPAWLADVARYELAAFTAFGARLASTWRVPPYSALRDDAPFAILETSHDVDPFVDEVASLVAPALPRHRPRARRTIYLFARVPRDDGEHEGYRCAIDDAMRVFLEAQRIGRFDVPRPAAYATLVEVGLCR